MTQKTPGKLDQLTLRVLAAVIMVPAGLALVWSGQWFLVIAAAIVGYGLMREWHRLTSPLTTETAPLAAGLLLAVASIAAFHNYLWAIVALLFGMGATLAVWFAGELRDRIWFAIGLLVIGLAISGLIYMRSALQDGLWLVLFLMVTIWTSDIAAYFTGKTLGGPLLAPRGSPNKTWSGYIGALVGSALMGVVFALALGKPIVPWVIAALSISLLGQWGDLFESYLKRHFNAKDSGGIIPGHGGLMDRLDSFALVCAVWGFAVAFSPVSIPALLGLVY